ncbi:hypothetical protein GQ42DRAFT_116289, partial [Ramicandelaber brevisporus]
LSADQAKAILRKSKLDDETLANIWDLSNQHLDGRLGLGEFVVAMWLVDECLAGRELPDTIP